MHAFSKSLDLTIRCTPLLKNIGRLLLFLSVFYSSKSCVGPTFGQRADSLFLVTDDLTYFYSLKRPVEKYFLPYVLEEISGLSFQAPDVLVAVNDEMGKLFTYDLTKRKIVRSTRFQKPGDYEGVEVVADSVYVLRSDGDILPFSYTSTTEVKVKKVETALTKKNDTEGLGYDAKNHRLVIACKEKGAIADQKGKGRAFYSYDLATRKLNEEPLFRISAKKMKTFWESKRDFTYEKDRIKFKPSAIALHPIDGHYYILSSVGKYLLVVNQRGDIMGSYPLSPRVFIQPEGLCFSPAGDMYISSEGDGDRGYVVKFDMQRK